MLQQLNSEANNQRDGIAAPGQNWKLGKRGKNFMQQPKEGKKKKMKMKKKLAATKTLNEGATKTKRTKKGRV